MISASFNSRPSCEGRPNAALDYARELVSIHAPRARGDRFAQVINKPSRFQFTPLVRGATRKGAFNVSALVFQFTPLVRGATRCPWSSRRRPCFNSRPSCEGRPIRAVPLRRVLRFNSRPSCEGRLDHGYITAALPVSIHAPRARGDTPRACGISCRKFQFTPLVRGATSVGIVVADDQKFQFTPLVRGATTKKNL